MTPIEQLVEALGARIDAFSARDPGPILHPRAAAEAEELGVLALTSPGGAPIRAAVVLALLHWYRCLASPDPDDRDRQGATMWWSVIAETDPQAVPAALREVVTDFRESIEAQQRTAWAVEVLSHESKPRDKATLGRAIDALTAALNRVSEDDPEPVVLLWCLSQALSVRFDVTGMTDDLRTAIEVTWRLVRATSADDPGIVEHLTNLGCLLTMRTQHARSPEDLDEAISLLRQALILPGADRELSLSNLAAALHARFDLKGETADLDQAIEHLGAAAAVVTRQPSARAKILCNLGIALATRYERTGEMEDLERSTNYARETVALTPDPGLDRARYLSNLCSSLQLQYMRSGDPAHFNEALKAGREALDLTPRDHPSRRVHLINLALLLTRPLGDTEPAHQEEAVRLLAEAGLITPADHPDRAGQLAAGGASNLSRFARTGRIKDLDEAIRANQAAAKSTPCDHPARARYLAMASALLLGHPGRRLDEAIHDSSEAYHSVAASTAARLLGAQVWAPAVALRHGLPAALGPYTAAVELLGNLAWLGVSQRSQRHLLTNGPTHLAHDAAASAVAARQPDRAVQLLESGRALIWSQLLDIRSDLTALRQVAPHLADRLTTCRSRLEDA